MSKIKDLYAIENGIDDLMPVDDPKTTAIARLHVISKVVEDVKKNITDHINDVKAQLLYYSEIETGTDDEGHVEYYFENYYNLCHEEAIDYIDCYIEQNHLDVNEMEYEDTVNVVGDWLADELADYESECINDFIEYNNDKAEAYREYNRLTLGE